MFRTLVHQKKSHTVIPSKITHHHHSVQNHTSSCCPKSHFIIPYKITLHHLIHNHTITIPSKNHTLSSRPKPHIVIPSKITLHHPIQNRTSSSHPKSHHHHTLQKSHIIIIPSKITHHHPVQNHTSSSHTKSHFIVIPSKITHHHPIQRKGIGGLHQHYNIHKIPVDWPAIGDSKTGCEIVIPYYIMGFKGHNEPAPSTSAPSTGCPLLLSCG